MANISISNRKRLAKLVPAIAAEKKKIADARDKLREMISEVADIVDDADDAVDAIERAVDDLSKYL